MQKFGNVIQLQGGTCVLDWTDEDKPGVNYWYRTKEEIQDYWKILRDGYDSKWHCTLYRIVSYYDSECVIGGIALWQARQMMKDHTYRQVIKYGL